jgi:hypothetical protein
MSGNGTPPGANGQPPGSGSGSSSQASSGADGSPGSGFSSGGPPRRGAPRPSAALLAAVSGGGAVRTRRPGRALAAVALVAVAWAALFLAFVPMRRDLPFLPHASWVLLAFVWTAGVAAPLAAALLPRRRQVLPDGARAAAVALAATVVLVAIGLALPPSAPGHTIVPVDAASTAHSIVHCLRFGMLVALAPLVAGLVALRRLVPVAGARLLAAVGAAAGALGGLVLHVLCPLGGPWHVGFGHGGAVAVAAALGAGLGALLGRRRA